MILREAGGGVQQTEEQRLITANRRHRRFVLRPRHERRTLGTQSPDFLHKQEMRLHSSIVDEDGGQTETLQ